MDNDLVRWLQDALKEDAKTIKALKKELAEAQKDHVHVTYNEAQDTWSNVREVVLITETDGYLDYPVRLEVDSHVMSFTETKENT
jgi:hypothetical protein